MNHNDTKIGKDYFIMELEKAGIPTRSNGKLRQTHREYIDLNTVILPYIKFEHPEFNRVLNEIRSTRITETKGALQLSAVINGFSYDFGLGGIHGSVSGQTVKSCCDFIILDADVKSYYPNITIVNRIYPEHLSDVFCDVYDDVYQQRLSHAKGTPENAVMKLALNGVYGDSNSEYSAFYDPKYTMSVTINGQLMLCMLAEQLIKIPKLTVISINTDGICCKVPKIHTEQYYKVCDWWSEYTGLTLEYDYYKLMAIRDVNNFIGLQYEEAEIDADIKKP